MKAPAKSPKVVLVTDRILLPPAATFLAKHRLWLVILPWLCARVVQMFMVSESADLHRYFDMSNAWFAGQTPYQDFLSEYPPGALLLFALPRMFTSIFTEYVIGFAIEMLCVDAVVMFLLAHLPARVAGVSPQDMRARYDGHVCMLVYVGLSALLVALGFERYDLACAALILGWLYCTIGVKRLIWADLMLCVGIWVKLIPALCVPLYLAYLYASAGERAPAFWYKQQPPFKIWFAKEGLVRLASLGGLCAVLFGPFYFAAGNDLWGFLRYHAQRGLQLESLYANGYLLAHQLFDTTLTTTYGFGALEVFDPTHVDLRLWIAKGSSVLTVLVSLGLSLTYARKLARSNNSVERHALLCTGTVGQVLAMMILNKVLSPQYLLWLAPLAPLAFLNDRDKRHPFVLGAATATFLTALIWMFYYRNVMKFEAFGLAILTCRNLLLLTLLWAAADLRQGAWARQSPRLGKLISHGAWVGVAAGVALFWAFAANLSETTANDIWIQLRSGADIVRSGHFPATETYSATVLNRPFIAHEWLSSVIFYGLVQAFGGAGLSFLAAFVAVIAAILLYTSQPVAERRTLHYVPLLLVTLYLISFRLLLRPHIFTIVAQCALLLGVERFRRSGAQRDILWLIPMQLVWVNLHGAAFFGPAFMFAMAGLVALMVGIPNLQRGSEVRTFTWQDVKVLAGVGVGMSLACLCNPYGWQLLRFSIELLNNDYAKARVWEWTTPFMAMNSTYYWLWLYTGALLTLWITLAARLTSLPIIDLFVAALVSYLSMRANRFVPDFAIFAFPIMARSLVHLEKTALPASATVQRPWLELGLAALLLSNVVTYGYAHSAREHRPMVNWGFGGDMPYQEVSLLRKLNARGIIFNEYSDGALIIHSLVPQVRPVLDSRIDLYPLDVVQEYDSAYVDPTSFKSYVRRHHVNYVMLKRSRALPALLDTLAADPEWTKLSDSNDRVLYARAKGSAGANAASLDSDVLPTMLSAFPK